MKTIMVDLYRAHFPEELVYVRSNSLNLGLRQLVIGRQVQADLRLGGRDGQRPLPAGTDAIAVQLPDAGASTQLPNSATASSPASACCAPHPKEFAVNIVDRVDRRIARTGSGAAGTASGRHRRTASRPEQVASNAAAAGVRLSGDVLGRIDQAVGDVAVTDPGQTVSPSTRVA